MAALAVGTVGVLTSQDDDGKVDAGSPARARRGRARSPASRTVAPGRRWSCGSHLPLLEASSSPSRTSKVGRASTATCPGRSGPPFEVTTPALTELTTAGKVEPVDLERGPAVLFLAADLTQIQYDPDGDEPCTSFSVTVEGPNQKETSHRARQPGRAHRSAASRRSSAPTAAASACPATRSSSPPRARRPAAVRSLRPARGPDDRPRGARHHQVAEIHVPGLVFTDLVGERVEDVELRRGTADVLVRPGLRAGALVHRRPGAVRVVHGDRGGWHRGRQPPRRRRPRRPHPPRSRSWRSRRCGHRVAARALDRRRRPTEGDGSTFTFGESDVTWTDGCNEFSARSRRRLRATRVGGDHPPTAITSSDVACEPNPTSDAIAAVMAAGRDRASSYDGDLLVLTAGDIVLTLRPRGDEGSTEPEDDLAYAIWPMTAPERPRATSPESPARRRRWRWHFAREVLGWPDAVVDRREPSEDGRNGAAPPRRAASRPAARWRCGCGRATRATPTSSTGWTCPAACRPRRASVSVLGRRHRRRAPAHPRSRRHIARQRDVHLRRARLRGRTTTARRSTVLDEPPTSRAPSSCSTETLDGQVIGAWGTALPAGDFAAG